MALTKATLCLLLLLSLSSTLGAAPGVTKVLDDQNLVPPFSKPDQSGGSENNDEESSDQFLSDTADELRPQDWQSGETFLTDVQSSGEDIQTPLEDVKISVEDVPHVRTKRVADTDSYGFVDKRIREFVGKRGADPSTANVDLFSSSPSEPQTYVPGVPDGFGPFAYKSGVNNFVGEHFGYAPFAGGNLYQTDADVPLPDVDSHDVDDYAVAPTVKRIREFVGKRSSVPLSDMRSAFEDGDEPYKRKAKRIREFVGKRDQDELFNGGPTFEDNFPEPQMKRIREFVGKRDFDDRFSLRRRSMADEFKPQVKRIREFVGKRSDRDFYITPGDPVLEDEMAPQVKRIREFVGKRDQGDFYITSGGEPLEEEMTPQIKRIREFVGKRNQGDFYVTADGAVSEEEMVPQVKRIREFVGKRDMSDPVGVLEIGTDGGDNDRTKRIREFVGKRNLNLNKRIREFVGKRNPFTESERTAYGDPSVVNKRIREFVGKRNQSPGFHEDKRIREFVGKRGGHSQPSFGKRAREFVGKRDDFYLPIITKRVGEYIAKRDAMRASRQPMTTRTNEFVGEWGSFPKGDVGMGFVAASSHRVPPPTQEGFYFTDYPQVVEQSEPSFSTAPVSKRIREFVGKRDGPSGTTYDSSPDQEDVRYSWDPTYSTLKAKRIREFVGKRDRLESLRTVGKRFLELLGDQDGSQQLNQRTRGFVGDYDRPVEKRVREFVGK